MLQQAANSGKLAPEANPTEQTDTLRRNEEAAKNHLAVPRELVEDHPMAPKFLDSIDQNQKAMRCALDERETVAPGGIRNRWVGEFAPAVAKHLSKIQRHLSNAFQVCDRLDKKCGKDTCAPRAIAGCFTETDHELNSTNVE